MVISGNEPKLYHLHIPRTGGTNILYAMQKSLGPNSNVVWPKIFEFSYDHERMNDNKFISGHFALNPILQNHGMETFSIIREPIDHFVSVAAYRTTSTNSEFSNKALDNFIENYRSFPFSSDIFGLSGNLQTKHLTCRLINFRDLFTDEDLSELETTNHTEGYPETTTFFEESTFPSSEADLLEKIKNIRLFKFFDVDKINNYIDEKLHQLMGVRFCGLSQNQVNSSVRNRVTPSPQQVKDIGDRCKMDMVLYEHVCSINK
jgi:hypothetical protein